MRDRSAQTIEAVVCRVIGPLRRRAPEYVDAGDLAQEARIACWEALGAYDQDSGASLPTFLYTVGRRAGLRWIRTEAHLRGITESQYRKGGAVSQEMSLDALDKNAGRDGLAGRVASREYVQGFLRWLSENERIACEHRIDGLTSSETAYLTDGNASAIRRRLTRVRCKAKEWFEL